MQVQSFGDAVVPTFIQEEQDLVTEQFVDPLLNEVLAWPRDETQPRQRDDITVRPRT